MYLDYRFGPGYYGLPSGGNPQRPPFVYMVLWAYGGVSAYTLPFPVGRWEEGPTVPVLGGGLCLAAVPPDESANSHALNHQIIPVFKYIKRPIYSTLSQDYSWLIVTMALFGKMTITVAFQIAILYSSELFPTEVRSRGIGTCFMLSRIGSICSPFITDFLGSLISWAPSVVFGAASLVIGLATVALPETLGMALPDTIADLEERDSGDSRRSFLPSFLKKSKTGTQLAADRRGPNHACNTISSPDIHTCQS
ncbi:solute carrier family 22 member 15-like [Penaeus monodon]|uniref:solute carrier family 22 member 15-like n=1 Tax=Penaeus monodon TaxID=6687 RepID=UPI0018A74440|nr:solute carrier family 22 member 15-like [Penaeus monodon]